MNIYPVRPRTVPDRTFNGFLQGGYLGIPGLIGGHGKTCCKWGAFESPWAIPLDDIEMSFQQSQNKWWSEFHSEIWFDFKCAMLLLSDLNIKPSEVAWYDWKQFAEPLFLFWNLLGNNMAVDIPCKDLFGPWTAPQQIHEIIKLISMRHLIGNGEESVLFNF